MITTGRSTALCLYLFGTSAIDRLMETDQDGCTGRRTKLKRVLVQREKWKTRGQQLYNFGDRLETVDGSCWESIIVN